MHFSRMWFYFLLWIISQLALTSNKWMSLPFYSNSLSALIVHPKGVFLGFWRTHSCGVVALILGRRWWRRWLWRIFIFFSSLSCFNDTLHGFRILLFFAVSLAITDGGELHILGLSGFLRLLLLLLGLEAGQSGRLVYPEVPRQADANVVNQGCLKGGGGDIISESTSYSFTRQGTIFKRYLWLLALTPTTSTITRG